MSWKFGLPLLLLSKILGKVKQFCWSDLKSWTTPYYQALKFSRKQGSFVKAIRKFELRLWWRAEMFSKIRQFWWYHLKIWTASEFLQKCPIFNEVIWTIELSWSIILSNKRQFWWCLLKVWPFPIITKWNFDRTVLMSLEKVHLPLLSPSSPYYEVFTKSKTINRNPLEHLTYP